MLGGIKELIAGKRVSKKLFALVVGVVVWLLAQMKLNIDASQVGSVLALIGGYIGIQGLQDALAGMGSKREEISAKVHKEVQKMALKKLEMPRERSGMKMRK